MFGSTSFIEISKSALLNNLNFIRETVGEGVKISSVVKSNAYGHGIEEFVPLAESCGIDHFAVFSADEAIRVFRLVKPATDVMVMGWMDDDQLEWCVQNGIEFYVFELNRVEVALKFAKKLKKPAKIHIEVETGMNRTGFPIKTRRKLARILKDHPESFEVMGICTHFAGAESIANHVRVQKQIARYHKVVKWFHNLGITPVYHHTASSAATVAYPRTRKDMVRVGILQYGFWPSKETLIHYVNKKQDKSDPIKQIINWKSKIMSIKNVNAGEFISYGTTFLAQEDKRIAIIPVGYSHGFSRSLSNTGRV
ncbi:MAG: alanine racemase, partial [Bacteroidales bacterium]|nr:alanine racemase [Bacteroidales bacterium]